jgi:formylglycine-generating enzyme required for sulfatase activity
VAGIRADCDAAERYQAADSDVSRLRASAFKAEGEQKEKSGDLSGAVAALEEAVKLNSSLGLKTERAVLHVKLGEQAVAKQDYAAAATELDSAVSLDKSATGVVALAGSVAEPVIVAFEQAPTVENQTAALAALTSFQSVDAQNEELPVLRKRVTAAVLKRGESVADKAPDSALKDYETALSLGASASESTSLKGQLVTALTARCRQSLAGQDAAKASADYATVMKLDSQAASSLVADFEKLPASSLVADFEKLHASSLVAVFEKLPASVLLQFPPRKNSIGIEFKLLPGGTFTMGEGADAHQVTLTKPFELGVYEVTQEQYEKVMVGRTPSRLKGSQNPVENVSWDDAVKFCRKLSERPEEKLAGYEYRLPTEAEWEYACRAGTTTAYSFGDSNSELGDYAWYDKNSGNTTHPVGGKKPNPWGLYDMHGNVFEWCQDGYGDYPSGSVTDPTGAASGSYRVLRGGSFGAQTSNVRSADRGYNLPFDRFYSYGFRPARTYRLSP